MQELSLTASVGIGADNSADDVLNVQKALNQIASQFDLSQPLAEDGELGADPAASHTCQAIALFQSKVLGYHNPDSRIDCNGKSHQAINKALAGSSLVAPSLFLPKIEPKKGLTDDDYHNAAEQLGCEVAAIQAVSDVESAGSGFFDNGAPCLLFEAHQFSKHTDHRFDDSDPDISSPTWNRALYAGGVKEYPRLQKAMSLDRNAALKSASYGRYQIMGFNHKSAGYDDVESFVTDMFLAESNHLGAFVNFIRADSRLHEAIVQQDWTSFARYYNGPGYAENHYDERLKEAYESHCAQPVDG